MKNHVWSRLLLAALLTLNLSACGGSGGGGSDPGQATTLSGVVEDGPVAKATVYAQHKSGTGKAYGHCVTDEQGRFTLTVGAGVDLSELMLVAHGGKDGTTGPKGLDFKGMDMMAPLAMFQQNTAAVVVSPVTTLVGLEMRQGAAYDAACVAVAGTLKLPKGTLGARPSVEGGAFHAKTMMLSLVAVAHQRAAGAESTDNAFGLVRFSAEGKAEAPDGADAALYKALADIEAALNDGVDPGETFVRARLLASIVAILDANSPISKKEDADFKANARQLIDDILVATGGAPINLESMAADRISRFVLRTAGLSTYDKFMGERFPYLISWVKGSKEIAALATPVAAKYDVAEALFDTELPGDDNAKRLAYYYDSDASHLFKAEKLIETVLSDSVNDSIMLQVAAGRAEAGFFKTAEEILDTKIFSTDVRGVGYTAIGKTALRFSKRSSSVTHAQAVGYLDKAGELFKTKIESAGKAFFKPLDAGHLQSLTFNYREAGELAKADALNVYATGCIDEMAEANPVALGRILVSMRDTSERLIEAGDETEAAKLPEVMVRLAEKVPGEPSDDASPSVIDNYSARISGLGYAMAAYGDLYTKFGGDSYKRGANDAYLKIKALRDANPYTLKKTWSVVADPIIPVLTAIGEVEEVNALLAVTPDKNKDAVYTAQATTLAMVGKMDEAFQVVDKISTGGFWGIEGAVSALTYYADNDGVRWIASNLIDAGPSRYADAARALRKAEDLLDAFTPSNDFQMLYTKIDWGYVKLARLYGEIGSVEDQARVLEKAEACIDGELTDPAEKIEMLCKMAPYWQQAGDDARFARCMEKAREIADDGAASGSLGPDEVAENYKKLMRGYMVLDEREKVREFANILTDKSVLIFDESITKEQWETGDYGKHDKLLTTRGKNIYYAADALIGAGYAGEAVKALDKAIGSKAVFFKDSNAVELCTGEDGNTYDGLVHMYARADAVDKALAMTNALKISAEVNKGIEVIAASLAERDRFPERKTFGSDKPTNWVADIDTDGDGKPNFFHPMASAEDIAASGLTLDSDSDGDGVLDTEDTRPLYAE